MPNTLTHASDKFRHIALILSKFSIKSMAVHFTHTKTKGVFLKKTLNIQQYQTHSHTHKRQIPSYSTHIVKILSQINGSSFHTHTHTHKFSLLTFSVFY